VIWVGGLSQRENLKKMKKFSTPQFVNLKRKPECDPMDHILTWAIFFKKMENEFLHGHSKENGNTNGYQNVMK
jgi:hypothetical protein